MIFNVELRFSGNHAYYSFGNWDSSNEVFIDQNTGEVFFTENLDEYQQLYFDANCGLGIELKHLIFAEFNYPISLTKRINTNLTEIRDSYYNFTLRVFISSIFK